MVLSALGLFSPRDAIAVAYPSAKDIALADGRVSYGAGASAHQSYIWRFMPAEAYRRLFVAGHTASLIALFLGSFCLTADLARLDRIALLFISPTPTFITLGTWLIVSTIVLSCVTLVVWGTGAGVRFASVRVLQVLSFVAGLGVALYTGLLLQGIAAVPLWATIWLPILFLLSSVSCGIALIIVSSYAVGALSLFGKVARRLLAADALLIVLEVATTMLLVAVSLQGNSPLNAFSGSFLAGSPTDAAAIASAGELLCGANAWIFWLCFVAAGMAIPLMLECIGMNDSRKRPVVACVVACCVLLGGFAMRYCIITAGMHPVVMSAATML